MRGQYLTSDNPELLSLCHSIDVPQDAKDGDFRSEHPYAVGALSVALMGAGAVLVFPAVLAAIGFGSARQPPMYESMIGNVYSLRVKMEVSPLATLAGAGLVAAGAWLLGDREDPAAVEPENNNHSEL